MIAALDVLSLCQLAVRPCIISNTQVVSARSFTSYNALTVSEQGSHGCRLTPVIVCGLGAYRTLIPFPSSRPRCTWFLTLSSLSFHQSLT